MPSDTVASQAGARKQRVDVTDHEGLAARWLSTPALLVVSVLTGWLVARAAYLGSSSVPKQMLLPIVMAGAFWFAVEPTSVFFAVMLTRASIDKPFEFVKFGNSGVGALYNAAIICLLAYFVFIKPRKFFTFTLPTWAPFILVAAIAVARAPDPSIAKKTFFIICSCMAVFSIPMCMKKWQLDLDGCRKLILLSSIFPVLYGCLDFARGGTDGGRIMSTFLHENIFAFYLSITIAITFMALRDPDSKLSPAWRIGLTLWSFVLLIFLGLTGTRSAWVGFALFFMVYSVFFDRKFLVYMLIGGVVLLSLPPVQNRLSDLFESRQYVSSLDQTNSFSWRLTMWRLGLGYLKSGDYWLGRGLDSFYYYSLTFNPLNYNPNGAHSVFVQTIFEMGIAGVASIVWLFFNVLRVIIPLYRRHRYEGFTYLAVLGMFLVFCFGDNLYDYLAFDWYISLVVGTGCASAFAAKARSEIASPFDTQSMTGLSSGPSRGRGPAVQPSEA